MNSGAKLIVFVILLLVGGSLWYSLRRNPQTRALDARALAAEQLASALARAFPNSKALVISNPYAQKGGVRREIEAVEDAGIRGLKKGFGNAATIVAVDYPGIRREALDNPRAVEIPDTTTPLSYLIAPDSFDHLLTKYPACDAIISLIGLPADVSTAEFWQHPGPPHVALLLPDLRMLEDEAALRTNMQSGKLVAFVLRKPDGLSDQQPLTASADEEFQRRFLLVTSANLDATLKKYPELIRFRATAITP